MLSKISASLFKATMNGCFLLFFYNNQTHRTTKAHSARSQKQALQTRVLQKLCFLRRMFFKIIVLKQAIKKL